MRQALPGGDGVGRPFTIINQQIQLRALLAAMSIQSKVNAFSRAGQQHNKREFIAQHRQSAVFVLQPQLLTWR